MRDQKISNDNRVNPDAQESADSVVTKRRALIKGAAGALPMILTLQSGAALARSSNLIKAASPDAAKDHDGRTLCMDGRSVGSVDGMVDGVADLGEPPFARVAAIHDRNHFAYDRLSGAAKVSEAEMCEQGGQYYYRARWGWRQVHVQKGMLVSATALSSFAGKIDIIDI